MEAGVKIRDASVNPPAKPARLVWALPVAHRDREPYVDRIDPVE